ncbi:MAG: hypothetical protein Dasosvirus12_6 [Dasosvirus sp.]|uniref:Ankyrin repeat protein n=1 Tax=Dasosvirus sp. TaxID=2487764 RepID=A0A3G4ZTG5_9VIRU|nr:MAG: hypothetical protein Dasosvirus12_6 [Dasosvirus sp.]
MDQIMSMNHFEKLEGKALLKELLYMGIVDAFDYSQKNIDHITLICHTATYSDSDAYKNNYKRIEEHSEELPEMEKIYLRIALCICDLKIVKLFRYKYKYIWKTSHSDLFIDVFHHNTNLEVIKYIIDEFPKYYTWFRYRKQTYLMKACLKNTLENIKYLIKLHPLDLCIVQIVKLFEMACCHNKLDVVKYLHEECKQKLSHAFPDINCLVIAFLKNDNYDVIKYLIDVCHINIKNMIESLPYVCDMQLMTEKLCYLIPMFCENYAVTTDLIDAGLENPEIFHLSIICENIKNMNPLMIKKSIRTHLKINDPFQQKYQTFVQYVDLLHCTIPLI